MILNPKIQLNIYIYIYIKIILSKISKILVISIKYFYLKSKNLIILTHKMHIDLLIPKILEHYYILEIVAWKIKKIWSKYEIYE